LLKQQVTEERNLPYDRSLRSTLVNPGGGEGRRADGLTTEAILLLSPPWYIGLNYTDHAKEVNLPLPKEPAGFIKANSSITGPNDAILRPRDAVKLDYEVELGAVIGRDAKYVSEADAMKHVAGYCIVDDFSERAFQMEHAGTTTKGKSCDTFAPIGPWLV